MANSSATALKFESSESRGTTRSSAKKTCHWLKSAPAAASACRPLHRMAGSEPPLMAHLEREVGV